MKPSINVTLRFAIGSGIIAFAATTALATDERTDQLLWKCTEKSGNNPAEAVLGFAQCLGYLDGVLDTHSMMVGFVKAKPIFCAPKQGISLDQAHKIFVKWASDNPAQLHESARTSVMIALRQALPCAN